MRFDIASSFPRSPVALAKRPSLQNSPPHHGRSSNTFLDATPFIVAAVFVGHMWVLIVQKARALLPSLFQKISFHTFRFFLHKFFLLFYPLLH
jgi:hypothetical protein